VLVSFAVTLLQVPYLKLAGGILLFWIGIKLLAMEDSGHDNVHASNRLIVAIRTIVVADLVMSIDNVIAVASSAEQFGGEHQIALVAFGIAISIPIVVWGSRLVLALMERFTVIVTAGAALLGYLAGDMVFSDTAITEWLPHESVAIRLAETAVHVSMPGVMAAFAVVVIGRWLANRRTVAEP
jgi:YjbE family integral membrane protein